MASKCVLGAGVRATRRLAMRCASKSKAMLFEPNGAIDRTDSDLYRWT